MRVVVVLKHWVFLLVVTVLRLEHCAGNQILRDSGIAFSTRMRMHLVARAGTLHEYFQTQRYAWVSGRRSHLAGEEYPDPARKWR
jgi:hypothetical protein